MIPSVIISTLAFETDHAPISVWTKPAPTASWHFTGQPSSTLWMKWSNPKGNCDCEPFCTIWAVGMLQRQAVSSQCFVFLHKSRLFPREIRFNWFNITYILKCQCRLLDLYFSDCDNVLQGSERFFVHHIESVERAEIAHCALGYKILRFACMNQMILSDRWSDSSWIKESNFPCIIQKDHFLFLLQRSTSLLWPHKISYSALLHSISSQFSILGAA